MKNKKTTLAIVSMFVVISCLFQTLSVSASSEAGNSSNNEQIIATVTDYYDDGSYTVTVTSAVYLRSGVVGSKTSTHYDSSHNKLYALKVYGTFIYNGSTVTVDSKSYETFIYDNDWTVENVTTSQSGSGTTNASVTASGKGKKHFLGITIQTSNISVTVYCDKNGNPS